MRASSPSLQSSIIFRVESELGEGPYRPHFGFSRKFPAYDLPTPQEEGWREDFEYQWRCGFVSLKQLRYWFGPEARGWLRSHGFIVGVYRPSIAYALDFQAVFQVSERQEIIPWALVEREGYDYIPPETGETNVTTGTQSLREDYSSDLFASCTLRPNTPSIFDKDYFEVRERPDGEF